MIHPPVRVSVRLDIILHPSVHPPIHLYFTYLAGPGFEVDSWLVIPPQIDGDVSVVRADLMNPFERDVKAIASGHVRKLIFAWKSEKNPILKI